MASNKKQIFIDKTKKTFVSLKKTFFGNRKSITGTSIVILFILLAVFGPIIFPLDESINASNQLLGPSWKHPFGTNLWGIDVFRQVVKGSRNVLSVAVITAVITLVLATVLGISSGLIGGIYDRVIQFITNALLTIPSLPVFLILAAIFTVNNIFVFSFILAFFNWAGLCRAIRSQVISLKERDFIQICKVMKMSKFHIVFKELLPNIASYIIISFVIIMKNAITGAVSLMFLGVVALEPTNWGAILAVAKNNGALLIPQAYMWLFGPIVTIGLFQLGVILLSSGLDEALNPRLRVL